MYFNEKDMTINRNNYEIYFLLYVDGELSPAEKQGVDSFLMENKDLQKELSFLQQTVLSPNDVILFEEKNTMLRKEDKRRIVPFYWTRIAAAVALLLGGWYITSQISNTNKMSGDFARVHVEKAKAVPHKDSIQIQKPVGLQDHALVDNNILTSTTRKKETVIRKAVINPAQQLSPSPMVIPAGQESEEILAAVKKPSEALEPQPGTNGSAGMNTRMVVSPSVAKTPTLLVAARESKQEEELQTDNAISVIALNDGNKGISGLLKKITKRAPADDNEKRVRVSVFQFSY
jgi:hypothetical protein